MPQFDENKARILIAYIASRVDVGKTKLMKLLYLIDFACYERTGRAITNDQYRHWIYGPVPTTIWKKMSADFIGDLLNVEETPRGNATYLKFTPKEKEINTGIFTADERAVIEEILGKYGDKYQDELVSMVHAELPWSITEDDEIIPYFLASYRDHKPLTKREIKKLKSNKEFMKKLEDDYRAARQMTKESKSPLKAAAA